MEILDVKKIFFSELKSSVDGFNSRLDMVEKRISISICRKIHTEAQRENRLENDGG